MQQGTGDPPWSRPGAVQFETLAQVLAEDPAMVGRLLVAHVATDRGTCAACRATKPERWPCGPRRLAERAAEIAEGRST